MKEEKNKEWKVTRDGKLWNDRFDTEDEAIVNKLVEEARYPDSIFIVEEMTKEDFLNYK